MNKERLALAEEITINNEVILQEYLLPKSKQIEEKESIKICQIKRFYERWITDRNFREELSVDASKAINHYNLKVNAEEVRPLWDTDFNKKNGTLALVSSSVKRFQNVFIEGLKEAKLLHFLPSIREPRFKFWRERQIARVANEFHPHYHETTAHFPVCFELSKGCSVGCPFCGVSAPRLDDIFLYNRENAKLWREVLELMKVILGDAAGMGFCYWATEPLDNPDYEKFCLDFHEVLGNFPSTTTAKPLKDPERIRALLKLSAEKGCRVNRFSILSLKILSQVHEEYSAEELSEVMLVPQNPESLWKKANAGRARERNQTKAENISEYSQDSSQGSIACVTGFLFNMVERSVKLISPCNADDRWTNGYIVYDEGTFSDINSLRILLEKMIGDNMPLTVRDNEIIRFRRDLKYESLSDGFQLSTKYLTRKFCNQFYFKESGQPCFKKLGGIVHSGDKTKEEIALLFETDGVPRVKTLHFLNFLFNKGVLDEEPQANDSKIKTLPTQVYS